MFSELNMDDNNDLYESVIAKLKYVYKNKLLPLEQHYHFHDIHSSQLEDSYFDAKPMILLVGQYSTGKTTFIKYLLQKDFPGIQIGPEPTTNKFIAVMYDDIETFIPGNTLVVDTKRQFKSLSKFGNSFLSRFYCSTVKSPVLKNITIIDTPGILSGTKQELDRKYNFTGVLRWFAERVDRIILLFDAHKLDMSDEFRRSIEALNGYDEKIRIVLNKADMINQQELMRVHGALMWSLGKVFQTPEIARVYIGSFWDKPLHFDTNKGLFEEEKLDLLKDLQSLPRNAVLYKLNDLIKRARLAKVHAYIIAEIDKRMPYMFGKDLKKIELINNLDLIYDKLQYEHQIAPGDFPEIKAMQEHLHKFNFSKVTSLKLKLVHDLESMLADDISSLMAKMSQVYNTSTEGESCDNSGASLNVEDPVSQFVYKINKCKSPDLIVYEAKHRYNIDEKEECQPEAQPSKAKSVRQRKPIFASWLLMVSIAILFLAVMIVIGISK